MRGQTKLSSLWDGHGLVTCACGSRRLSIIDGAGTRRVECHGCGKVARYTARAAQPTTVKIIREGRVA